MKIYKRLFEEKIPKAPAYWIDPGGRVLPVFEDDRHISLVLKRPEAFGLDIEEIKKLYAIENEELGIEGRARDRIIKELVRRGWIRIRHYAREETFTVNVPAPGGPSMGIAARWCRAMLENGMEFSQVKIDCPDGAVFYSIRELADSVLPDGHDNEIILKTVDLQGLPEMEVEVFLSDDCPEISAP